MKELTEQEHEELMACEFVVKGIWDDGPYTVPGRLVEIDSDIGITIVSKENSTDYLYCILGPSVSNNLLNMHPTPGLYDALFKKTVQDIRNGVIDLTNTQVSKEFDTIPGEGPSADFCAFNR